MTLRNAFAGLVTESLSGAIELLLNRMDQREARRGLVELPRALQYARDASDQMRVVVGGTATALTYSYWGNANTYPVPYSTGSPTSMDARTQQAEASMQTFNQVRTNRWKVT